jgi:hypothetical protein
MANSIYKFGQLFPLLIKSTIWHNLEIIPHTLPNSFGNVCGIIIFFMQSNLNQFLGLSDIESDDSVVNFFPD